MKLLVLLFLVGFATASVLPHERQEEEEERGLKEYWEKLKDWFSDKYTDFREWVNETFKDLPKGATTVENIKKIAKEFKDAKNISKEVAEQAKEFFDKHKNDLGDLYHDVKATVEKIKNNPTTKQPKKHKRKKVSRKHHRRH